MRLFRFLALFFAALTLVTGCSSNTSAPATGTIAPDPYAVPAVIDEAYATRVVSRLYEIRTEVRQTSKDTRAFSAVDEQKIRSIYTGDALTDQLKVWGDTANQESNIKSSLVPPLTSVTGVVVGRTDCMVVHATTDDAPNRLSGEQRLSAFDLVMVPTAANETHWAIKYIDEAGSDTKATNCD